MKTETFKGEIGTAYGEKLKKTLPFSGSFEAYENYAEVPEKEKLTEKDMLEVVNEGLKATKRAAVIQETLDQAGIAKPDPNSPEALKNQMVKTLMKAKKLDEESAIAMATDVLGY